MSMRKIVPVIAFIVAFCVLFPGTVQSQPSPPGDPNGGNKPGVPISGVEWLLAAGAALGVKKLFDVRKKKKN